MKSSITQKTRKRRLSLRVLDAKSTDQRLLAPCGIVISAGAQRPLATAPFCARSASPPCRAGLGENGCRKLHVRDERTLGDMVVVINPRPTYGDNGTERIIDRNDEKSGIYWQLRNPTSFVSTKPIALVQ